ncbi:hypothetical protein ABZ837_37465 [Streptomyces sp. NPDC047197]
MGCQVPVSVNDPEQPYRFLEIHGRVHRIVPDTEGMFFQRLAAR